MNNNIKKIGYKIISNFYKIKLIKSLILLIPDIKKLNTFIDNRKNLPVLAIKLQDWLSSTFDELTYFINKKEVINKFTNFINIYNKFYPNSNKIRKELTPQKILSIWIILAYPEFIIDLNYGEIDENKSDYKTDLYILTKELLNIINNIVCKLEDNKEIDNEVLRIFNKKINSFMNCFDYYLLVNKQEKINSYIKEWCTLEKSIQLISTSEYYNINEKEKSMDIINKSKKILERYMNKFNIDISFNILKENVSFNIKFENELKINYENNLRVDLSNNNYNNLRNILTETKDFIRKFTKLDKQELDEHIDIDFIIQIIQYDVISINDIVNFGTRVINDICLAGSIFLNQKQIKEWNKINTIQDKNTLISKLLLLCLESINEIYEEIIAYKEFIKISS